MKIIEATRYGDERTVIKYCENPDDLPWVHVIGEPQKNDVGEDMEDEDGSPILITSSVAPDNHTGDTIEAEIEGKVLCYNCHSNHRIKEELWDGNAQFKIVDGIRVFKSMDDLEQEFIDRITMTSISLTELQDKIFDIST